MTDDIAIKIDGVSKDFKFSSARANTLKSIFTGITHKKDAEANTQHALKNVSFDIKKGEFFGIVGRNGSGKSTLLKIIAGIYQPNKGKVLVAGKLVPFIELGVGFNPELTGRENVYMNGALLGFSVKEIDKFYDEVVEFAELEKFMDKKLKNYSSGMQVRLAFSMAIRANADVLLVDEVLAVGDADFQRKCFDYFRSLKQNKKTVVFVSHDMNSVKEFCDRAVLINDSKVVDMGDPGKIANKYIKLFSENISTDSEGSRWGDGKITYTSISAEITDRTISISLKAKAKKEVSNFIFGFDIKSSIGETVVGTNSLIVNKKVNSLKAGDTLEISWEVPNIFSNGEYLITPTIIGENHTDIHDWWENAAQLKIMKSDSTPYRISPNIKLNLNLS